MGWVGRRSRERKVGVGRRRREGWGSRERKVGGRRWESRRRKMEGVGEMGE